jgi:hypothetical protein|tara:strand:+ start:113 stop:307 length:195 start_codon:yes stop_codon:yes gene_type:complete
MKTELIQALSNANINSDSAEIIASEYISYLYFSEVISNVSMVIILCSLFMVLKSLLDIAKASIR